MTKYKYIKFGSCYISMDQNSEQIVNTISHIWNNIQSEPIKKNKLIPQHNDIFIADQLGDFCKLSNFNNSYKIFNIDKKIVTKFLSDKYSIDLIKQEISRVKKASSITYAPSIFRSDTTNMYYEEEYILGKELWPKKWENAVYIYKKYILDILISIIMSDKVEQVSAMDYATQKYKVISYKGNYSQSVNSDVLSEITNYSQNIMHRIKRDFEHDNVLLSYVHGDFKFSHIIIEKNKNARVIDWENYEKRSLLFDFFNPLGPWLMHNVNDIKTSMKIEFEEIINNFDIKLQKENCMKINKNCMALNTELYKNIYFLDRISRIIEVGGVNRINNITRAIDSFNKLDKLF